MSNIPPIGSFQTQINEEKKDKVEKNPIETFIQTLFEEKKIQRAPSTFSLKEKLHIFYEKKFEGAQEKGDFQAAIQYFKIMNQGKTNEAEYWNDLGCLYTKIKSNEQDALMQAKECFRECIKLDRKNIRYHINYSHVLFDLGEDRKAGEILLSARDIDPNHSELLYHIGLDFKEVNFLQAIAFFKQAIARFENPQISNWKVHQQLLIEFAYLNTSYYVNEASKIVKKDHKSSMAQHKEDYQKAILNYNKEQRLYPIIYQCKYEIGYICLKTSNYEKAIEYFQGALILTSKCYKDDMLDRDVQLIKDKLIEARSALNRDEGEKPDHKLRKFQ